MPLYDFQDLKTGEVFEEYMTWEDKQDFLKDNPQFIQAFTKINIVAGVSGITHKNDDGFKELMTRISDANPDSEVAKKYGDKGVKESKTRDAINKWRKKREAAGDVISTTSPVK